MPSNPFTIENIPYGIISTARIPRKRCATAYEKWAVDLEVLESAGLFDKVEGFEAGAFGRVSRPWLAIT